MRKVLILCFLNRFFHPRVNSDTLIPVHHLLFYLEYFPIQFKFTITPSLPGKGKTSVARQGLGLNQMTCHPVIRGNFAPLRLGQRAAFLRYGAARAETAARRRVDRAGHISHQDNALAA
jgi:hypothetical protein